MCIRDSIGELVDGHDDGDDFQGEPYGLKDQRQCHHNYAGHSGRADGRQRDGDDQGDQHGKGQIDVIQLGNKYNGHALHDGGAVHIQRCAQRDRKGGDLFRNAHATAELDGIGDRGVRGGGGEGDPVSYTHLGGHAEFRRRLAVHWRSAVLSSLSSCC